MSDNSVDWEERALRAEAKLTLRTGEADAKTTIIKELEAKLAKAVDVIEWALIAWDNHCKYGYNMQGDWVPYACTTLAEIEGGKDE